VAQSATCSNTASGRTIWPTFKEDQRQVVRVSNCARVRRRPLDAVRLVGHPLAFEAREQLVASDACFDYFDVGCRGGSLANKASRVGVLMKVDGLHWRRSRGTRT
jgi:hypothetical protein